MRILFTFIGGSGHFIPLVPIARAAHRQGHSVAFGCGPSMASTVQASGFPVFALGDPSPEQVPPPRLPLRPVDGAREEREFRDRFARAGAQTRAPHTLTLCRAWRPDVLVCDEADFGGMVAAERLDLPYAVVLVMAAGTFVRAAVVGEVLQELRAQHDLPPDPQLTMLTRHLVLNPFPPSFRHPDHPLPPTAHSYRPGDPAEPDETSPWLAPMPAQPLVYFTLGTVFNLESGNLFTRVLAGLRALPVNVLVTVGPHLDPAELGPQPSNVHVANYIPQERILPHCRLVVSHAGSGSVAGALLHGLPSLLIPMGADQSQNADRCQELGLARVLNPLQAAPTAVRAAAQTLIVDASYRRAAHRLQSEYQALPDPASCIPLLETTRSNFISANNLG